MCEALLRLCKTCSASVDLMSRHIQIYKKILALCAKSCRACVEECEKYSQQECQRCAEACRRYADECESAIAITV
ncbi:four-helix bundle copper-binding protein [Capsulimonas corticalis]|uniref:four-helix bundle copper-binding protein n=1 Tax=Capsulimonas corticalis TaxID=2219043 RepID=UPI000E6525E2